jgi:hypothetical protein
MKHHAGLPRRPALNLKVIEKHIYISMELGETINAL